MKIDINMTSIWAIIVGTVTAVVYMFSNFVSAEEFREFQKDGWYTSYYLLMDKKLTAEKEGEDALAAELDRQMERLRSKICKEDPHWERCESDESG